MRDKRFVALHRGGPLTKDHHHQLMRWARECSGHVVSLIGEDIDQRLMHALSVARAWENEKVTVGEARKAAVGALAVARETSNPLITAIARSIGHAVATAHMADHSIGAAEYALKAVKLSGHSVEEERKWQDETLTPEISELILTARQKKKLKL
jgi:hypothetical protein